MLVHLLGICLLGTHNAFHKLPKQTELDDQFSEDTLGNYKELSPILANTSYETINAMIPTLTKELLISLSKLTSIPRVIFNLIRE